MSELDDGEDAPFFVHSGTQPESFGDPERLGAVWQRNVSTKTSGAALRIEEDERYGRAKKPGDSSLSDAAFKKLAQEKGFVGVYKLNF